MENTEEILRLIEELCRTATVDSATERGRALGLSQAAGIVRAVTERGGKGKASPPADDTNDGASATPAPEAHPPEPPAAQTPKKAKRPKRDTLKTNDPLVKMFEARKAVWTHVTSIDLYLYNQGIELAPGLLWRYLEEGVRDGYLQQRGRSFRLKEPEEKTGV